MDFETFKENLVRDVKEAPDARTGGDTLVETRTVDKMNETYDAITVKPEDAVKNAPEIRPLVIEGMAEVLAKQMGVEDLEMLGLNIPPEQEQMFVASVFGLRRHVGKF